MKKIILLLAGFCFLFSDSFSQEIEWQKCLGGTDHEYANSIIQTFDGSYVLAGGTFSNDGDVSGNHSVSKDFWIVKIDSNGILQWQKCLGGTSFDDATSIQQTSDSGYVVGGYSSSDDGDVSSNYAGYDYWIVKLDAGGNIQWQKSFGGSQNDEVHSILQTSDGGYIAAGEAASDDYDVSGSHGGSDYWIVKLDTGGNLQWQKCLGGSAYDYATSIIQTADDGYMVAGYSSSNNGDVTGNHGFRDVWVVKTDSTGNLQWQKSYGGSADDEAYSILQTSNGGFIISGVTGSNDGDVTGNHGLYDCWLIKADSTGNIEWQKCLGGSAGQASEAATSIRQDLNGDFIVAGVTPSNDGDVSGNHGGGFDVWIVKLDSSGYLKQQKCFGGTGYDVTNSIQQTANGDYIFAGWTDSDNGDVSGHKTSGDFWVVKLNEHFNLVKGKLFIDADSNNSQDAGEPGVVNRQITELNTGRFSFSQNGGTYYLNVLDSGNFIVASPYLNSYNAVPFSRNVYFSGINQTDSLNDFAFQPAGVFNDLCVTITPMGNFRANMNANYMINYENVGTTTLNGTVIFFPDNDVTFVSSNVTPTSVTTDSVVWNVGTLTPFQTGNILVTVHVNTGTPNGTLVNSSVVIEPVAGDANTACNYNSWEVFVTGSFDPNAILVDRDTVLTTELSSPPYLNYIIYFQNTGNDTAFNARVLNNIPQKLDVNSFEFVASSHIVNVNYGDHSRLFTFTFDNILLPDSNVNEPASHGFIRYRIKPLSTLVAGDSIKNNAAIYFDFNYPVLTDTAVTEIVLPNGVSEWSAVSGQLAVYPNPAQQSITIFSSLMTNDQCQMTIYDLFGREVYKSTIYNLQSAIKINVSGFSQGIYLIQLTSGEKTGRAKFVKQ